MKTRRTRTTQELELAALVGGLADDTLIDVIELAAITGFTDNSIRQRKVRGLPDPDMRVGRLRWRLGNIRQWIRGATQ